MHNQLETLLLLAALSALLVGPGSAVAPGHAFGLALLLSLASYVWSDRIVLAMDRARPVAPELIVSPLAGAGGVTALSSTHPPLAEAIRRLRALAFGGRMA